MDDHNNDKPVTKNQRPSAFQLTPSQAVKLKSSAIPFRPSSQKSENDGNNNAAASNNNNNSKSRRRKNNKDKNSSENNRNQKNPPPTSEQQNSDDTTMNTTTGDNNVNNNNKGKKDQQQKRRKQKQKQKQKQPKQGNNEGGDDTENHNGNDNDDGNNNNNSNSNSNNKQNNAKKKNQQKKKNNKKKFPWRRHIPKGTVDPITLENLQTLEYPPFALVADMPYIPVPEWPIIIISESINNNNDNKTSKDNNNNNKNNKPKKDVIDVEDLNRERLAEQWGMHLLPSKKTTTTAAATASPPEPTPIPLTERPLNLFDGRALAFYMVSQLQFIDPFTRRDLTRPELVNLDRYLSRYGGGGDGSCGFNNNDDGSNNNNNNINRQQRKNNNNNNNNNNNKKDNKQIRVTDAYDAKGITLSSAGAAAATAQGRADIMQQMAQNLLNSLFSGHSVSTLTPNNGGSSNANQIDDDSTRRRQNQQEQQQLLESFSLQEQYTAMQRYEQASTSAATGREQQNEPGFGDAGNYYNDGNIGGGGFTIIDDDENPELRGRNDFPSLSSTAATATTTGSRNNGGVADRSPFYSASHIAGRHGGNGPSTTTGGAFPSLQSLASTNNASSSASPANAYININNNINNNPSSKAKKSKTLSKISGIVKKTTSEEKEKQWNAREAARRKALMSNLTFGSNPSAAGPSNTLLTPPTHGSIPSATDEQLERNRAFAEALGVKPATQRDNYASGWARPTTEGGDDAKNELLHELDAALYPDTIIAQARDRMSLLLKLEKKWMRFLNDDKAASLPLNNMDKPSRKFVHLYAEFWNLKTESFDPEPKRYIHCVKLLNTRMPMPLLSDTATRWRGPTSLPDATRTLYDSLALPDATRTLCDHTSQQTAGQTSKSRELPPPPNRVPLSLKNRSISPTAAASSERAYRAVTSMSSSKGVAIPGGTVQNSRSDALMDKERPQLELLPRSVPLELPPLEQQTTTAYDAEEDLRKRQARMEERRLKERKIEEKKKQVLEEAFASDDEDDFKARISDSDSEWGDEQEALYIGSDEE
jgi:hypothetical protein